MESLSRVKRGEMTVVAASELMGLSLRQSRRVWKQFKEFGDVGLVHRLRGRVSNQRFDEEFRDRVVKRHQERYADFGPTLASEKLAQQDLELSPNTVTAMLKERGVWQRRRRRGRHRSRRERRACCGAMVQMQGSLHQSLQGRADMGVLMVVSHHPTNPTYARFYPAQTTEAAFDVLRRWVRKHAWTRSGYVDRHGIYRDQDHPVKPTQCGRAMKEHGVERSLAHSPQALGRVERRNAGCQHRRVKEMRLRKSGDMAQGNALLECLGLDDLNRRDAVVPGKEQDLHRAGEAGVRREEVLCVQEERVVGQHGCVRWRNRWLQIPAEHAPWRLAGRRVTVKQMAGGALGVEHQGQRLAAKELWARPMPVKEKKPVVNNRNWKPPADHPWKQAAAPQAGPRVSLAPAAPTRDLHAERKKAG